MTNKTIDCYDEIRNAFESYDPYEKEITSLDHEINLHYENKILVNKITNILSDQRRIKNEMKNSFKVLLDGIYWTKYGLREKDTNKFTSVKKVIKSVQNIL